MTKADKMTLLRDCVDKLDNAWLKFNETYSKLVREYKNEVERITEEYREKANKVD